VCAGTVGRLFKRIEKVLPAQKKNESGPSFGGYRFDKGQGRLVDVVQEIEDYFMFTMEFCLEWSKYTYEDLTSIDEVIFFRIFLRSKERQEKRAKWEEKQGAE
jgi:hypothetical protein